MRSLMFAAAVVALAACSQPAQTTASTRTPATEAAAPATPAGPSAEEIATRVAALPAPYNAGSYEHGRSLSAQCRACHTFTEGGGNRVGPNLHGLFGRKAGAAEGFNYSDAVRNSNITWDEAAIDHWLANPREALPGNRMSFPGLPNANDRRDLITFLRIETAAAN